MKELALMFELNKKVDKMTTNGEKLNKRKVEQAMVAIYSAYLEKKPINWEQDLVLYCTALPELISAGIMSLDEVESWGGMPILMVGGFDRQNLIGQRKSFT